MEMFKIEVLIKVNDQKKERSFETIPAESFQDAVQIAADICKATHHVIEHVTVSPLGKPPFSSRF